MAAAAALGVLLVVYVSTLAPGVTFWDAGEFIAAVHTLGIPHPPGTPLYVLLAKTWADLLPATGTAVATNLLSAVCTAAAGGITAYLIVRSSLPTAAGVAAALCAGGMASVWMNATETEVYAASLLLATAMLLVAERAGRTGERRWLVLTAYLFALAGPLHLSALVAAPAAIVLATTTNDGAIRRRLAIMLAGAALLAAGLGSASWGVALAGALLLTVAAISDGDFRRGGSLALALLGVAVIATTAFGFLYVRSQHDPAINQGNPSTWDALIGHVARRQYAVAAPWPRQAPGWLQLANVLQYAEWQVAFGIAPGIAPTAGRTLAAVVFGALGVVGALHQRRRDQRLWRVIGVLLLSGSFGVVAYLNLKAGPSLGYGVLPDGTPHEPRERDYFFALAFWSWGIWAGIGAWAVVARFGRGTAWIGVAVAALPILLNWRAMDRRREPEASLPFVVAEELLAASPPRGVLFVWGDNDTYPLWYAQQVRGVRPDVTIVTIPLLGAPWYRDELARRGGLLPREGSPYSRLEGDLLRALGQGARERGRDVAVAASVPSEVRSALGGRWVLLGVVYVEAPDGTEGALALDSAAAWKAWERLRPIVQAEPAPSIDPAPRLMRRLLACPGLVARSGHNAAAADSLDSLCNLR